MTQSLKTDFHIHVLPGMDDGAATVSDSLEMLRALSAQGVEKAVATPHYYAHREPVSHWLERRLASVREMTGSVKGLREPLPVLYSGAEVALERDLSKVDGLEQLRMGETDYLLIELPYAPFQPWMPEEIYQICYRWHMKPMIAHLDRFYPDMTQSQLQSIYDLEDVVIQMNNDALAYRRPMKFVRNLIRSGMAVVFGSDAHDTKDRPVNFEMADSRLSDKLKEEELRRLIRQEEAIFRGDFQSRHVQMIL